MLAVGGAVVAGALGMSGTAMAAFPDFTGCPFSPGASGSCLDIQSPSGSMTIKGFYVPLPNAFEIRGGVDFLPDGSVSFVPARGTNGFFARSVNVPGGLLGIDLPIPGNQVSATAELAGTASSIRLDFSNLGISLPIKLRLSNPLIGGNCHIGTNADPAYLNLITGTTSPPAPNRPISGAIGTQEDYPTYTVLRGNLNVDNSFRVPRAYNCGIGLGLIDSVVNAKLKLPSAAGNNEMRITNNLALKAP